MIPSAARTPSAALLPGAEQTAMIKEPKIPVFAPASQPCVYKLGFPASLSVLPRPAGIQANTTCMPAPSTNLPSPLKSFFTVLRLLSVTSSLPPGLSTEGNNQRGGSV